MTREHLYVALTRGRDANHAYTPLDAPGDDEPHHLLGLYDQPVTGRQVLEQILATSSAETSATEAIATARRPQPVTPTNARPQNQPDHWHRHHPHVPDGRWLTRSLRIIPIRRHTNRGRPDMRTAPTTAATSWERVLLTGEEAANRLRIGRTTAYRFVADGQLDSIPIGHLRRVPVEALPWFVRDRRNDTTQ